MKFYSPSKNAFYAPEFQSDYEAAGTWPSDLVEVLEEDYASLQGVLSGGKTLSSDEDGNPIAIDAPVLPPPVPQFVTMRQARLALLQVGKLQAVNDAVAAMSGENGDAARIEWEFSSQVQRDKQLVHSLAPVLGFNDSQLDDLFILAASL